MRSLLIFLLVTSFSSYSQIIIPISEALNPADREWEVNDLLDSIMNKGTLKSGGIICLNEKSITIDTLTVNRFQRVKSDSVYVGKFLRKHQKKISSKEFWGIITDYGEVRRFYQKDMYLVWETPSPYIYRIDKNESSLFYFSETLLSPLVFLNKENVNLSLLDDRAKEILNGVIDNRKRDREMQKAQNRETLVNVSGNILMLILQIMVSSGGHSSHSHSDYRSVKQQTGPRRSSGR